MSESKTYVVGENSSNAMMGMIAPFLQSRGLDPNMVMAMMNNRNGYGEGGWFMWIIFLFFLMGWGNWGGNRGANGTSDAGLANLINNDAGREMLMQALQGNSAKISELANILNCSTGQVQQAINNLQLSMCQQTNTLQTAINSVATGQERGFSSVAYETQRQTCDLQNTISNSTNQILAGQRAAEMREMQNKLDTMRDLLAQKEVIINNGQQTAMFSQMITQATAPITVAINNLQNDVNGIKCQLPKTTTVPYNDMIAIPSCVAAQYGLGLGLGLNGIWG